jgi:hypothetical protein
MGFFSKLRSSLEPNPKPKPAPVNPAQSEFAKALTAAITVVSDFGAAIEAPHPEDGLGPLRDEKHLPHSRANILWATDWIQKVLASDVTRSAAIRVLTPEMAQYLFSERYVKSLGAVKVLLDDYVPEEKLVEQRGATALMSSFLESLSPEDVAKRPFPPGFVEELKKVKKP